MDDGELLNLVPVWAKHRLRTSLRLEEKNTLQRVVVNGIATDGSFIFSADRGGSAPYALDLDLP